ncbi:MAG: pyridoxamine 5'-phosphate oxidase family protein [Aggregatilineales bacterium]
MDDAIKTFLEKPLVGYMATIAPDGYPHIVPTWFALDGEDIISSTIENRARARYSRANPKSTITIGGNKGDGAGYMFVGDVEITPDEDMQLMRQIFLRYTSADNFKKYDTDGRVILRLKIKKIISVY